MEKEMARHSKNKQTALLASSSRSTPTTVNDIPNQLLKLIFRRLDSHVAYVRAAAVCTRWRRVASTRGVMCPEWNHHDFFSTIGYYHVADRPSLSPEQGQLRRRVVFVPSSPNIDARQFTLDFLPTGGSGGRRQHWDVIDGCDSLLLVGSHRRRGSFPDLVVCEPISRRYVTIQPLDDMKHRHCLGVFLNKRYRGVTSMYSFGLTCVMYEASTGITGGVSAVTARVYRHRSHGWSGPKHGWSMPRHASSGSIHVQGAESARYVGRSKGFIFWGIQDDGTGGTVIAAREGSCVLSHFRLPDLDRGDESHQTTTSTTFRFVDDDNDNLVRLVSLAGDELRVFLKPVQEHEYSIDWVDWENWVPVGSLKLREATSGLPGYKECFFSHTAEIVTAEKGYVVLTPAEETWLFSVDLATMQAEVDAVRPRIRNRLAGKVYPYELRLPPRVRVSVISCKRGRYGRCYDVCKCN